MRDGGSSLGCFQALLPGITPADKRGGGGHDTHGMPAEGRCRLRSTLSRSRSERVHRQGFVPEAFPERGQKSGSSLPFPETWQLLNSCHHPQQTMSKASPGPAAAPGAPERRNCGELAGDQEAAQTAGVMDPSVTTKPPGCALSRPKGLGFLQPRLVCSGASPKPAWRDGPPASPPPQPSQPAARPLSGDRATANTCAVPLGFPSHLCLWRHQAQPTPFPGTKAWHTSSEAGVDTSCPAPHRSPLSLTGACFPT